MWFSILTWLRYQWYDQDTESGLNIKYSQSACISELKQFCKKKFY